MSDNITISSNKALFCGVWTSWTRTNDGRISLHFAVNRYFSKEGIHFIIPNQSAKQAAESGRKTRQRLSLYCVLDPSEPTTGELKDLSLIKFVDSRFNNLKKGPEYVLGAEQLCKSPATRELDFKNSTSGTKVTVTYFPVYGDQLTIYADPETGKQESTYLWTSDESKLRRCATVNEAVDIISKDLLVLPSHIQSRQQIILTE
jgi:hypothetical protein